MSEDTPFRKYSRILASSLALAERIYEGSLGTDSLPPEGSRIARDPLDVLADIVDVFRATDAYIKSELQKDYAP